MVLAQIGQAKWTMDGNGENSGEWWSRLGMIGSCDVCGNYSIRPITKNDWYIHYTVYVICIYQSDLQQHFRLHIQCGFGSWLIFCHEITNHGLDSTCITVVMCMCIWWLFIYQFPMLSSCSTKLLCISNHFDLCICIQYILFFFCFFHLKSSPFSNILHQT